MSPAYHADLCISKGNGEVWFRAVFLNGVEASNKTKIQFNPSKSRQKA